MRTAVYNKRNSSTGKIIRISSKRQITIPQKYYEKLGFSEEAECVMNEDGLLIRPVHRENGDFSEQILTELIAEGYTGEELLTKFKEQSRKIKPAVAQMFAEADRVAEEGDAFTIDSLFGTGEEPDV